MGAGFCGIATFFARVCGALHAAMGIVPYLEDKSSKLALKMGLTGAVLLLPIFVMNAMNGAPSSTGCGRPRLSSTPRSAPACTTPAGCEVARWPPLSAGGAGACLPPSRGRIVYFFHPILPSHFEK